MPKLIEVLLDDHYRNYVAIRAYSLAIVVEWEYSIIIILLNRVNLNMVHLLRVINDPEHPLTLEELNVVQEGLKFA